MGFNLITGEDKICIAPILQCYVLTSDYTNLRLSTMDRTEKNIR